MILLLSSIMYLPVLTCASVTAQLCTYVEQTWSRMNWVLVVEISTLFMSQFSMVRACVDKDKFIFLENSCCLYKVLQSFFFPCGFLPFLLFLLDILDILGCNRKSL